jgi:hypothetical protein
MNLRIAAIQEKYKNPPSNENDFEKYTERGKRWFRDRRPGIPVGRMKRKDNKSKRKDSRPHGRKKKRF